MVAKKLTLTELAPIVADYMAAFPGWQLAGGDMLVRVSGPVAQIIWFDRLRTGAYRPTCRVHVLVAPSEIGGTAVLSQFLNIKIRELTLSAHVRSFSVVIAALKSEILPSLDRALDAGAVADLLRDRSLGRPANAYAVACLFGALGRPKESVQWIGEYRRAIAGLGLAPQPADAERDAFLDKVEEWLKMTNGNARFAEVVELQKARLLQEAKPKTSNLDIGH
jgi:hypothetical protein